MKEQHLKKNNRIKKERKERITREQNPIKEERK